MICEDRILQEFIRIVKINSPSRGERELADYLKGQLVNLGMEVKEDQAGNKLGSNTGNIIGRWEARAGGLPVILLAAHMDTVETSQGIKPIVKDGRIFTDGTTILGADDKAGIVAIMEALRQVREKKLVHGEIIVVFTVAEETGLEGAKFLTDQDIKADFGFVLDSGGRVGTVIVNAPAEEDIRIEIFGRSAHAGVNPQDGINAIQAAGAVLAALPIGRLDDETTANIGTIKGGKATNIVPDFVEMTGEIRSLDAGKLKKQVEQWRKIVEDTAAKYGAGFNYIHERAYDSFKIDSKSLVLQVVADALKAIGLKMELKHRGGGSDTNIFNARGIPSVNLAVGMEKDHTKEEYLMVRDLVNAARLVLALITSVAGTEGRK